MEIKVYGRGCPKCQQLEGNMKKALAELGIKASVEKVTELDRIIDAGVMMTPALEIDGKMVSSGRVPSPDEIKAFLG